ncbi:hypothetical protein HN51_049774 [Arachis hypogaea]
MLAECGGNPSRGSLLFDIGMKNCRRTIHASSFFLCVTGSDVSSSASPLTARRSRLPLTRAVAMFLLSIIIRIAVHAAPLSSFVFLCPSRHTPLPLHYRVARFFLCVIALHASSSTISLKLIQDGDY